MTNAALRITRPRPHSMEAQRGTAETWSAGLPTPVSLQHARLSSSSPGAPAELWAILSPGSSLCSGHGLHTSSIAGESGARAASQNRSLRTLNSPSGRIAGRSDRILQSATGNERASRADRPRAQLRRGASACHTKVGKFDWDQTCELLSGYMYERAPLVFAAAHHLLHLIVNVKHEAYPLQLAHNHSSSITAASYHIVGPSQ